jgi:hypothetical protein
MGNPGLDPETVLQLFHTLFYCMAYMFGGAAVIGLSLYIVLVCSEMFFSQTRSKTHRAKVPQSAHRAPATEESLDLSAAETPILAAPEHLGQKAVRVTAPPHGAQIPMTVPANLESEPTWL